MPKGLAYGQFLFVVLKSRLPSPKERTAEIASLQMLRRSKYVTFELEDSVIFNVESFLSGTLELTETPRLIGVSHTTQARKPMGSKELAVLKKIPRDWKHIDEIDLEESQASEYLILEELLESGFILVSNPNTPTTRWLLEKNQALERNLWPTAALTFHSEILSQEAEQRKTPKTFDYKEDLANAAKRASLFLAHNNPPPKPEWTPPKKTGSIKLNQECRNGQLFETLESRVTTRQFSSEKNVDVKDFSTILNYSFGALGTYDISSEFSITHKSSPSGGGLHPIEAFPIVLNVDGLEPGIYHYSSIRHELTSIQKRAPEELAPVASLIAHGQTFAGQASFLVVLIARWKRNFWKYRDSPNTYNVINCDAGHLSQTFYLVATALGLGAFYSAFMDRDTTLESLELDKTAFGAIGLCGCGYKDTTAQELVLNPT